MVLLESILSSSNTHHGTKPISTVSKLLNFVSFLPYTNRKISVMECLVLEFHGPLDFEPLMLLSPLCVELIVILSLLQLVVAYQGSSLDH